MRQISINDYVLIEMNERTMHIIETKLSENQDYIKHCILPYIKIVDGKKMLQMQLFEVMQLFGDQMYPGNDLPFGCYIRIFERNEV